MLKIKKKILRIIASLNPKFGGPSNALVDSSNNLIDNGHSLTIVTFDKSSYKNKSLNKKIKIINFNKYFGEKYKLSFYFIFWLLKNKNNFDLILIHGLWFFPNLVARFLVKKKYYIFSHGQLDPFFKKNFFKKLKKQIYWFFFEKQNLLSSKSLLVTSKNEAKSLENTYVNCEKIKKKIIKYGINLPKFNKSKSQKIFYKKFKFLKNKKFHLFLGRFHKKKGLEILINSIYRINTQFNEVLLLAGPTLESDFKNNLKKKVKEYNLQNKIFFSNSLYNELKWGAIQESQTMLLSSHGENFGVSLVESLSLGKPVITTNKVNISPIIKKYNAGFVSSDSVIGFSNNLLKFYNLNKKLKKKMTLNAKKCFKDNFDIKYNNLKNILN